MKKYIFLPLLALLVLPLLLVGCAQSPKQETGDDSEQRQEEQTPTTYSVSITLNDSSRGTLQIDNRKSVYNPGEVINFSVTPNEGYYLRGYSDSSSTELERRVVVNKNINIVVNLQEGESCTFYGYKIARNCRTTEKGMGHREGNTTYYSKDRPNENITSGELVLFVLDRPNFGAFELKRGSTKEVAAVFSTSEIEITQEWVAQRFGGPTNQWIDIVEQDTNVGSAYYTRGIGETSPSDANLQTGVLNIGNFGGDLCYIYMDNDQIVSNCTNDSENHFAKTVTKESGNLIYIQEFRLFKIDGEIHYVTRPLINSINKNSNRSYTFYLNGESNIITVYYE